MTQETKHTPTPCEIEDCDEAARAASYAASYDAELEFFAEEVVQILINMDAPATKYLHLTETN